MVFQTDESHPLLGQPLAIRLVSLNQIDAAFPGADLEVDFDLVRLTGVAVPEPSPLASGAGCMAARRAVSTQSPGNASDHPCHDCRDILSTRRVATWGRTGATLAELRGLLSRRSAPVDRARQAAAGDVILKSSDARRADY